MIDLIEEGYFIFSGGGGGPTKDSWSSRGNLWIESAGSCAAEVKGRGKLGNGENFLLLNFLYL